MKKLCMIQKLVVMGALTAACGVAHAADTWYVAKTGNDDTGDGTADKPYLTIQKGVDAASTGDTVMIGEGDYTNSTEVSITVDKFTFKIPTVVVIENKSITLKGAGRGKTFITGAYGNGTPQDGSSYSWANTGVGARRCVYFNYNKNWSDIRDCTLRNGATVRANTGVNNPVDGGGCVATANNNSILYLHDCDILGGRAGFGGATAYDVRACRCRFADNNAKTAPYVCYRNQMTYNCLFENNGTTGTGYLFSNVNSYKLYNCTFINNKVYYISSMNATPVCTAYNCLVFDCPMKSVNGATTNYVFHSIVQSDSGGGLSAYAASNCVWGVTKTLQCVSPASENWNAPVGNAIVGKGTNVTVVGFLSGDTEKDYLGNPRVKDGKVSVGCVEPTNTVDLAGSFLFLGGAKVTAGTQTVSGTATTGRWFGVEGTGQVRVGYTGEDAIFGYAVTNTGGILGGVSYNTWRFPDNNGDKGFWLTPTKGGIMTIAAVPAAATAWVDDAATADGADGSEDKPYKTIAAAVAAVAPRTLINVRPGTYDEGTVVTGTKTNRVNLTKDVAIRSTEGAAKTILKGGADITAIVMATDNARAAHLQGFTFTGCANDPTQDTTQGETGSALSCNVGDQTARDVSEGVHVTDSVISNNVSSSRAVTGGWLERCLLIDNFTTVANMNKKTGGYRGTQTLGTILSGCVSYYSPIYFTAGHYPTVCTCAHQSSTELNCTFYIPPQDISGKNSYRTVNLPNGATVCINCAMASPTLDAYYPSSVLYAGGNVSSPGWNTVYMKKVDAGAFFLDTDARDFRPIAQSVGLGYSEVTTNKYVRYEAGDFNGNVLAYATNGKPIAGAYQVPVCSLQIVGDDPRGTVEPCGALEVTDGQKITITATSKNLGANTRAFVGWNVDGAFVAATGDSPYTYTYTVDFAKTVAPTISVVFQTNLYVNASADDDEGDGLSAATAKRRLCAIGAMALAGDTIHAAAGEYNDGTMTQTTTIYTQAPYTPSRIVLPAGVTLLGEKGAAKTTITGVSSKGANGVRCVAAYAGAVVRGFTLRDGATEATTGAEYDSNCGGCVLAPPATSLAATALFEDCVIGPGYARTGGTVAGGYLHRCKVIGGNGSAGASIAQYAQLDTCFAYGTSDTGVREHYGVRSSTIINTAHGNYFYDMSAKNNAVCENSVIALMNAEGGVSGKVQKNMKNCIWNVGANVVKIDDATCCNIVTCTVDLTSISSALASLGLDAEGRPCAGSPVLDRGDKSLLSKGCLNASLDRGCAQRIYNAQVDIGSDEYVCTNEFTAAICGRRSQVVSASQSVTLVSGGVSIPKSGLLTMRWRNRKIGEKASLTVTLSDGASLDVYTGTGSDKKVIATITESGTTTLEATQQPTTLRFAAVNGAVVVNAFAPERLGLTLLMQ